MNRQTGRIHSKISRMAFIGTGALFAYACVEEFFSPFIPMLIAIFGSLIAGFLVRQIFVILLNKRLVSAYRYTQSQRQQAEKTQSRAENRESANSNFNPTPDSLSLYRSLLRLGPRFTGEELKAAYRNAAAIYHPDRYVSASRRERENAEDLMKKVNEAYECLKPAAV